MKVKVWAPATVANLASGFDSLGLALTNLGDEITLEKISTPTVLVESNVEVPQDAALNTAGKGLLALIADKKLSYGFKVFLQKNIPLSSGLGGSAAGAVGSIVAANEFLDIKLTPSELLHYSLIGESATGSAHYDNIAPCLLGGVVGISSQNQVLEIIKQNSNLGVLIIHQKVRINTHTSRSQLQKDISLTQHVQQSQNLLALILGLTQNNSALIAQGLQDVIIEPQRKNQIPNFDEIKNKFLPYALGGSISGSGPAMFFIYEKSQESKIKEQIFSLGLQSRFPFDDLLAEINPQGAKVV